jgi:hypothetical protein
MTMAVAAGMDNSKNVGEMVDATKNMSQSAGAFGADITSGAANTIGAQIQDLLGMGINKNQAVSMAQMSTSGVTNLSTDKGLNIANVLEMKELQEALPDASVMEIEAIGRGDLNQFLSISKSFANDPAKAQKSLNRLGFSGIKGKDQLDKIIDISQKQSLTQGMGGLFNPGMMDKIMKAGKSGMSISDLETQNPELFGEATAATKNVSGGSFSGLYSRLFGGKAAKGSIAARGAGADVEDVLAVPNISDAKKFSNSEFNNNISKLSEVLSKTIEGMNLEQMEEVVKNSAESLSQPLEGFKEQTITFQNTISDLDKTLNSFMDKIKDLINGESDAKKNNPDRTPLKESWKALSRMRTNKEG